MSRRGTAVAIALLLGAALVVAGCGLGPGDKVGSVDLTVTREFGAVRVTESSGDANESDTVMRFLEGEVDEVETRYGGGYVKSIDGIDETERGGHPYDWFFYVNGLESPVGAAEVSLRGGERIWWDLHDWSASAHVPAVVGSWPAPFTTGWEGHAPAVVVECLGGGDGCATVRGALADAGVKVASGSPKGAIRVLVGPWAKLRSDPIGALIEAGPAESGVYAEFVAARGAAGGGAAGDSDNGWELVGLDEDGKKARTFGAQAGLVAATRHFEGPPVWVVTGATPGAVRSAAETLDTADLRDHFAVESEAGAVTPLPLPSGS
ncbi:MAG TPA: DUF4430 domain-containing protein [Solirubrobacterales bacterium]|jgi:hypothetical protein|nr:DUF4430 domain-containing protein [Solirubrobacterales bacterium]